MATDPPILALRLRLVLAAALLAVFGNPWTPEASARNRNRDPLTQMETQRRRNDDRKQKRREEQDLQGAETRDAKKAAQDSHQSETQSQTGTPNERTNTWFGF